MNATKKSKQTFIGTNVGLMANKGSSTKLVRVEYYRLEKGDILLQPVSGHNLSKLSGSTIINQDEFDNRDINPHNSTREAIWALNKCGWSVGFDDD